MRRSERMYFRAPFLISDPWKPACAERTIGFLPIVGFRLLSFAGLVVTAESPNPIPSRTRPLNSPAPMVLSHEDLGE
jgi:hypothetical protein